ncbi:hypothetical protein P4O66_000271 [Electrophorus voltai]|uniref:PH domain-containing protein n=1 Tax=Electrophorus voltai TaxID=2609070 RepID=A0AAD9DYG6_9TELE|nr:hypothetical protein P4O66_000271 [Electrophorus voltai]
MKMCLTNQHIINMAAAQISWPIPMRAIGAQNLLTMPGGVTIAGVMRAAEETTSSNVFPFKIVHFSKRHRTWYFSSASEDERRKWMRLLRKEIDHYNNEKDLLVLSESDSDSESFYGQIESPLDITDAPDHPEAEYRLQDEDSDEEDYLLPDGPGHSKVPPPNYPPPPVPSHDRDHSVPNHPKGPPPPVPPLSNKTPPCPIRKKPSPLFPGPPIHLEIVAKGPPPPLPISLHTTQKSLFNRINGGLASPTPPAPSAACLKKLTVPPIATLPAYNRKLSPPVIIKSPSTLPICQDLENKVVLNNRDKFGLFNSHNHIPGTKSAEERKSNLPTSGGQKALLVPKPPLPGAKLKVSQPSLQERKHFPDLNREEPIVGMGGVLHNPPGLCLAPLAVDGLQVRKFHMSDALCYPLESLSVSSQTRL